MAGPPPNYNPNYPPGTRPHRDYARGRIRDRTPPGYVPTKPYTQSLMTKNIIIDLSTIHWRLSIECYAKRTSGSVG